MRTAFIVLGFLGYCGGYGPRRLGPSQGRQGGRVLTSFEGTLTKLKKAITASKLVIVKEVPYSKMIGMAGVKAEKTVGLEIFHPRYGKVLYENNKDAMIEAPLRILVRDQGGEVMIRYRKPSAVFAG